MADRDLLFFEQEAANPQGNLESFDAIYYAALQVVIVAGANGVSAPPTHRVSVKLTLIIITSITVERADVFHDRRGILRLMFLLYYCHRRAQFLAHQSFCGCNYEHVWCY